MKLRERVWIITLRRGGVSHLARSDEFSKPKAKTLCGQDTSNRKGAHYTDTITRKVCERCQEKLTPTWRVSDLSRNDSELKMHLHHGTAAVCGHKLARNLTNIISRRHM